MIKKLPARLLPRTLALGFAATVIVAVLGITGARMLPSLGDYRQEIEAWLAKSGGYPVMIGSIEAIWHGIAPSIEVTDMEVLDHSRTRSLLRFDRGSLRIDLVASLKQRRVIPDRLSLSGTSLTLVRTPEGKITVAGFTGNNDMARWLLQQRDLAIHWAQLVWHDEKAQRDPVSFTEVRLQSRHQQGRQVITGSVRLPPMMGGGEIKFRAKLAWAQAQWVKLTGDFTAASVKLASNTGRLNLREASGQFELSTINPRGWRLNVDQLSVATDRGRWPEKSHLTITVSDHLSRDTPGVRGYVSFLRLEDLAPLLAASPLLSRDLSERLQRSQPTGDLRKTYIRYLPQRIGSERFSIHTQFSGVTTRASDKLPGIHTIAGTLKADAAGGLLHLSSSSAALDFNPLFKKPLPLNTLSGEIRWREQGAQGWLISTSLLQASNRDLALKLSGDLIWTRAGNAIANLELAVDNGRIDQLERYLPTVVPKQVRTWLGKALVGGRITSARAILRGPLDQFPFDRHQGRFSVWLQVSDGVLEYSARWPRIEALATEIRFEGHEMTLHAARGRTLEGIEILDTTARIADLGAAQNHVQIHGHARGPATKAGDFIQHSPLKETVGQRIEPLTADGNFALELGLKIPFADVKKTRIKGTVILPANTVTIKGIGLKFTRLRGSLVFTEETLTGKGLEAQLFNRPVRIDIESTKEDAWIRLKGKADRAFLTERLAARGASRLFERVKGETDWQAKLDLRRPWDDPAGGENLEIRSSLVGLQIDAPAPLGKTYLGGPRPFILKTSLAHAPARRITLEYGEIFKAKLMLAGQSSPSLQQASIQLGKRTLRPANSARLWIGGRLEEFSLSQWTDFLGTVGPLLSSNRAGCKF